MHSEDQKDNADLELVKNRHLLAYGSSRLDPAIRLVDRAREIEAATDIIQGQVHGKLALIQEQIRALQEQAHAVLDQSARDLELHNVPCNFEKKAGQTIHLYQKKDQRRCFSLLSPAEWGRALPYEYVASYVLQSDRSFKEVGRKTAASDQ
ncbi:MAG: DUF2452 domain-containing protein [Leptospiraceae bacterium]|nr:DUF2452 domain-containing protein [Leptospiraceae bacterium]